MTKRGLMRALLVTVTMIGLSCQSDRGVHGALDAGASWAAPIETAEARSTLDRLHERFQFPRQALGGSGKVTLQLPSRASEPFHLRDAASGLSIDVATIGLRDAPAEGAYGHVVFRAAHPDGGDVVLRTLPEGVEDYVAFEHAPANEDLTYQVALGNEVAGLRLVENVVEFVDASGAPRLRVGRPSLIDADGMPQPAKLAVTGCRVDSHPAAPWGRPIVDPGSRTCQIHVTWADARVHYPALLDPSWTSAGLMDNGRELLTATTLTDGRVLFVGGLYYWLITQFGCNDLAFSEADLYDPTSNTWARTADLPYTTYLHTATLLTDGRVLVAGGSTAAVNGYENAAYAYNPTTGTWAPTGNTLATARKHHAAVRLPDGRVLVAGGDNGTFPLTSTELYDPATNLWSPGPSMSFGRLGLTLTLLQSGKALAAAGTTATAELFDPATNTWSLAGTSGTARSDHQALLLQNGNVAILGGSDSAGNSLSSIAMYLPATNAWTSRPSMNVARSRFTAALLASGKVLVAGGSSPTAPNFGILSSSEICDPAANAACSLTTSLQQGRYGHAGPQAPLSSGKVLVAGGFGLTGTGGCTNGVGTLDSSEVFTLSSNGTSCVANGECLSDHCANGVCCNAACNDGCDRCNLAGSVGTCAIAPQGTSGTCGGYLCDGVNATCPTSCTSDANCISTDYCNASGFCAPKKGWGQTCTATDQCASGFCVDGVCCNSACSSACDRCDLPTSPGNCAVAPAGNPGNPSCSPYVCNGVALFCPTSCTSDSNCISGDYCSGGQCVPKIQQGQPCTSGSQCATGVCADGVCCNMACGGQCQACNVSGSVGTCVAVTGTPVPPRPACTGDGSLCSGSCNGVNTTACTYPTSSTQCRNASCTNGVETFASSCNGAGSCPAAVTASCSPYVCGPTSCLTTCASDADCVSSDYCGGGLPGTCLPKQALGQSCSANNQCASAFCTDGVCCTSACNGGGCDRCNLAGSVGTCTIASSGFAGNPSCSPYVCNGTSAACPTSCTSDSNCISTDYCSNGQCVQKVQQGQACSSNAQCQTGFCVDGVCCNSACGGQCQACNLAGSVGICHAVTGSPVPPRAACSGDGSVCNGSCNGVNTSSCTYPTAATQCRSASCTSGVQTLSAFCDGAGNCPAPATQSCTPYVCGPTACKTSCASDADCIATDYCAGGVCMPKKTFGQSCAGNNQCASGFCADGVCCNATCSEQCKACNLAGQVGTCSFVTGAPAPGHTACTGSGTVCGGSCNGSSSACTYPTTQCRTAGCASGVETLAANCSGGSCPALQTVDCAPYVCGPTACKINCASDADCIATDYCSGGMCVAKLGLAQTCSSNNQCTSGFCADGVCCNAACGEQCKACNLAGQVGTCSLVSGAPVGGRPACASDGTACGGTCSGSTAACTYPTTQCRSASCASGIETLAANCNGAGACPPPATQSCAPYGCGANACLTSCTSDAGCVAGDYCDATGHCLARQSTGSCAADDQCLSGHCVDGVCCDSACTGQCQACNMAGQVGTCANVSGVPVGGRPACSSDGTLCGGACDGMNGATCAYPGSATTCRSATCAAGIETLAAQCDGAGACPAVQTVNCAPFACNAAGTACQDLCAADTDCVTGDYCQLGQCVPKQPLGGSCVAGHECLSGNCADGICCNSACNGQCEACGAGGICAAVTGAPIGGRAACTSDGTACGGICDGTNRTSCAYPATTTSCRAASCNAGIETLGAYCDGAGRCPPATTIACSPFLCDPSGVTCTATCTTNSDCVAGGFCDAGQCRAQQVNGSACGSGAACASGYCADGVCCTTACNGQCEACNLTGSVGACSAVTGAPVGQRAACSGSGICAGSCDGTTRGACAYPGASIMCSPASCNNGTASAAALCDGLGNCSPPMTTNCSFGCDGTHCANSPDSGTPDAGIVDAAGSDAASPDGPTSSSPDAAGTPTSAASGCACDLARAATPGHPAWPILAFLYIVPAWLRRRR